VAVYLRSFLALLLDGDELQLYAHAGTHCLVGWVEQTAGFGEGKNLLPLPGVGKSYRLGLSVTMHYRLLYVLGQKVQVLAKSSGFSHF
jgi:hypothetical protein